MFKRILIPLDGSKLAERSIVHAEVFARIFGASIFLLQVLEPTSYHENPRAVDPLSWQIRKTEADMYMQGIAARIRENLVKNTPNAFDENNNHVEYAIREGKSAENIVDFAHTENIDLLVISTHGSGGLSRWSVSSVTQKVINLIYLPVLIVRAFNQPETEGSPVLYRRILVPVDSSRRAECALPAGIALVRGELSNGWEANSVNADTAQQDSISSSQVIKLILTAVIKPPELPIPEPHSNEIKQLTEQMLQISRQVVTNYLNELKKHLSVDCETCVIENNSVTSAIQEMANQAGSIDLVVLCAHGFTGQSTWPFGSVARNYLEHGTKPVLVIQDVSRSEVSPTAAEIAAEKSGRR